MREVTRDQPPTFVCGLTHSVIGGLALLRANLGTPLVLAWLDKQVSTSTKTKNGPYTWNPSTRPGTQQCNEVLSSTPTHCRQGRLQTSVTAHHKKYLQQSTQTSSNSEGTPCQRIPGKPSTSTSHASSHCHNISNFTTSSTQIRRHWTNKLTSLWNGIIGHQKTYRPSSTPRTRTLTEPSEPWYQLE